MIREPLQADKIRTLRCFLEDQRENLVLKLSGKPQTHVERSVYTLIFDVMEKTTVQVFLARKAEELLNDNLYMLTDSNDLIHSVTRGMIKSCKFIMPMTPNLTQHCKSMFSAAKRSLAEIEALVTPIAVNEFFSLKYIHEHVVLFGR